MSSAALRVAACPKCRFPVVFGETGCRRCAQTFRYPEGTAVPTAEEVERAWVAAGLPSPPPSTAAATTAARPEPAPPAPTPAAPQAMPPSASAVAVSAAAPDDGFLDRGRFDADPRGGGFQRLAELAEDRAAPVDVILTAPGGEFTRDREASVMVSASLESLELETGRAPDSLRASTVQSENVLPRCTDCGTRIPVDRTVCPGCGARARDE